MKNTGIAWILGVMLLTGCSSDNGLPPEAPSARLDGTVTDAVITNATLRVFAFDEGEKGALIAETTTDAKGDFVFDAFSSPDRPIIIEVSGGRYTEEASGVNVELIDGQTLRAYMFYEQGSQITVQVTPFTHLASCLADFKVQSGVNVNNAITEATSVFSGLAGVDVLGTKPHDITDPENANFELTDNLRYGAALAAISSLTAEVSETNGVTPHRFNQNSSIYATQVLCQDISADGIFNGLGFIANSSSVGQLALGSVALDADTFRTTLSQHILAIIGSDRNQIALGVDDFVLYANEISSSTDGIFGGIPAGAVDQAGPTVTADISPDSFLKGIVDLGFTVTDPIGVKSVTFYVNDVLHSNGQTVAPVMSFNSTNYTDGTIKISVVAKDILNNESTADFNYVVDNSSPIASLTSATLVNNKAYQAEGTYIEEGAAVTTISVNGVPATIDTVNNTWSAGITLNSGENVVTIDIEDAAANSNSIDVDVAVDLIKPAISPNLTQVEYTTFQGQLNLCNSGTLDTQSANTNPVCISTDNVSLNGAALSGTLQNQGYVLLGFSPTDPQGAGVFTSQGDLIVEYMYELNNVEIVTWNLAPIADSNLFYFFPMVTEYLGNTWFQTTTDDVHKVTMRVTDLAGNSSTIAFELRFDVLVPEISVSTVADDTLFNAATFATRTSLDGAAVDVNYTFTNSNNTSILIALSEDQLHDVTHKYETGIRENRARAKIVEKWTGRSCGTSLWNKCPSSTTVGISSVQFTNHMNSNKYLTPQGPLYSSYQNVISDTVSVNALTGVPTISKMSGYDCRYFAGMSYNDIGWRTGAYANGNTSFTVCRFLDDDNSSGELVSTLSSTVSKSVQYQSGYPRNIISSSTVNYGVITESLTVRNDTLGQTILPITGWYRIPASTDITITKRVRLPVMQHYFDDLSNVTYSQKKQDKSTTWKIDTDITIDRAIDTGEVEDISAITASVMNIGEGIYTKTISR